MIVIPYTDRADWLEQRRLGLGATDIAAILGFSRFASPWSVWAEKVGLTTPRDNPNDDMRFGRYAELMIAPWFHDETGLHVIGQQSMIRHDTIPYLFATCDGFAAESPDSDLCDALGTVEMKAPRGFDPWPNGEIPDEYQAQGQAQLLVTGLPAVYFAVLHGRRLGLYQLQRDETDLALIIKRAEEFWHRHVLTGEPPPIDGSDATTAALAEVYPDHVEGEHVELNADDVLAWRHWNARARAVAWELKDVKNRLAATLGDAEVGTLDGQPVVTYRSQTRKSYTVADSTYRVLRPATKKETA